MTTKDYKIVIKQYAELQNQLTNLYIKMLIYRLAKVICESRKENTYAKIH